MKYSVRRFSYPEALMEGKEYISGQVDSGLGYIDGFSTKITEDPRLKDLKPVKRHVRLIRDLSRLLRRKKNKKTKAYSDTPDPTSTMNASEVNKFKTSLDRLTRTMGGSQTPLK